MATWHPPRSTARHLPVGGLRTLRIAAVIASMVLVGTLVTRGSLGLSRQEAERVVAVDPETGLILDGSAGLHTSASGPLFDAVVLGPGETSEACIRIDYAGDTDPDAVAMQLASVDGAPALMDELHVAVERGSLVDGAESCRGFRPEETVGVGTLSDLESGEDATTAWTVWDPDRGSSSTWYRITVGLDAAAGAAVQGAQARTDFVWSALGDAAGPSWSERAILLGLKVARDAALPLLFLAVVAILFLGIQDRIDRRDPKLALAPVTLQPLEFAPPAAAAPAQSPDTAVPAPAPITTGGRR